jgi:hypothetical protein
VPLAAGVGAHSLGAAELGGEPSTPRSRRRHESFDVETFAVELMAFLLEGD